MPQIFAALAFLTVGVLLWLLADIGPVCHKLLTPDDPNCTPENLKEMHDHYTSWGTFFARIGMIILAFATILNAYYIVKLLILVFRHA